MTNPDPIQAPVAPGQVLAGKYRVDRILGVGGMGVVVAAHHLHLDEHVAIKFLLPAALENPEAIARFDREARAAVKIKSEHVARVIDVGKLENGAPYMVMEYLEGSDLSVWLSERGPLPVVQAVEFVLQACEAIAEAHAMGIVHRDLKPANLYCIRRPDGALSIKVLDFGISKAMGGASMGMTKTHTVMGSPLYMSPEQLESSRGVDARADIWALGVILFQLVSGRVPFEGEAITELVLRIVTTPPPILLGLLPGVPPGLDPIIHRCLEKDRDRRYATVSELANDLVAFGPPASRLSVERIANIMNAAGMPARPTAPNAPPTQPMAAAYFPGARSPQASTGASWGQTGGAAPAPPRGSRAPLVFGVVALLLLLGVASALIVVTRKPSAAAASSAIASSSPPPPPAPASNESVTLAPLAASVSPLSSSPDSSSPPAGGPSASVAPQPPAAAPTHPAAPLRPASAPLPAAKPAGKANCDPPYFMDSAGHRQYKPECL